MTPREVKIAAAKTAKMSAGMRDSALNARFVFEEPPRLKPRPRREQ